MIKLFPFQGVPSLAPFGPQLAPSGPQLTPSGPRSQRFHRWSPKNKYQLKNKEKK